MKPISVGLLGIGTVGGGTFKCCARNQEEIMRRAGRGIVITMVADKDLERARQVAGKAATSPPMPSRSCSDPDIDIVVELIGGTTIAKELVLEAIENGKHVVTANKALLATHGNEIFAAAQKQRRDGRVRGRGRRRHPDHQGAARRPDRESHRVDRRHHQRHQQFHPVRDARQGTRFRHRAQGGAARWAMPRPIRPSTSKASTPRTSSTIMAAIALRHSDAVRERLYRRHLASSTAADIRYAEELGYRIKLLGITEAHA